MGCRDPADTARPTRRCRRVPDGIGPARCRGRRSPAALCCSPASPNARANSRASRSDTMSTAPSPRSCRVPRKSIGTPSGPTTLVQRATRQTQDFAPFGPISNARLLPSMYRPGSLRPCTSSADSAFPPRRSIFLSVGCAFMLRIRSKRGDFEEKREFPQKRLPHLLPHFRCV